RDRGDLVEVTDDVFITLLEASDGLFLLEDTEILLGAFVWRGDTGIAIRDLPVFETLGLAEEPSGLIGASLLADRDFILDFEGERLLVSRSRR
ncbi:MAG: hypothetical protein AAGL49_14380, partial [Pseudomonadota bacterium]